MSDLLTEATEFPVPIGGSPDLLIIAGEHSGDEHAAQLLADLLCERPDLKVACLGGVELQAAGAQLLYDLTAVSIVGFVEVVRHYSFFKDLFDRTLDWIERHQPRHICFVDYPGFNLRLADHLTRRGLSKKGGGSIGLSYYIGPQVWAWKAKRRFKMAEFIDRLGVIFPFELDCYADTDLPTEFVGHPFARTSYMPPFFYDAEAPVLLLPGSRSAAVGRIFPLLLEGFKKAREQYPALRAQVIYPSSKILQLLETQLSDHSELVEAIEFVPNTSECLPASAVLMSSGTMSLACALSGIPGAIAYRLNPMSYWLGRLLVNIKFIGIANLLLDRALHPEYIQGAATGDKLGSELKRALGDAEAAELAASSSVALRGLLGSGCDRSAAHWLAAGLDI